MKTHISNNALFLLWGMGAMLASCGQTGIKVDNTPDSSLAEKTASVEKQVYSVGNVPFTMIKVEGGSFKMGAQNENRNADNYDSLSIAYETPVHTVKLSTFNVGETEVTQGLWKAVIGKDGRWDKELGVGDSLPVYNVSFNEVQEFLKALNDSLHKSNQLPSDKNFSLPTEAQWEYAARGGNRSRHYYFSGSNDIDDVAWYDFNSVKCVKPVGMKKPNELGIFDMSGNVWEWCGSYSVEYPDSTVADPDPQNGKAYALRGGGIHYDKSGARCGCRGYNVTKYYDSNLGFRLCLK